MCRLPSAIFTAAVAGWRPFSLAVRSQVFIDHCNFYGTYDVFMFIDEWGAQEVSLTNCTAQDQDNTKPWGWAIGRFYSGNGIWGTSRNTYIGNNTTTGLTSRPGPEGNQDTAGWPDALPLFTGSPTAATATTVTFTTSMPSSYSGQFFFAVVTAGTGMGQWRNITANTGTVLTVNPAWTVQPTNGSTVIVGEEADQNSGEQCMWEGNIPVYRGTPTAATSTTVTFGDLTA